MEPNNTPSPENEKQKDDAQQNPADALSRTPEDLQEEQAQQVAAAGATNEQKAEKKVSPIKRFFRKINLYFLMFLLLVVVAGVITAVNYLNSQKEEPVPDIGAQTLTDDALKQLANTDASVGSASQTLTIQGNAIISGQTLMRGNLNVAGNFQAGGTIQGPSIRISGAANLGEVQTNGLQVANNAAVQGSTTLRDVSVAGTSTFSGAMTASQITVSRLVLSGNGSLQVPNHISFSGPSPSRTVNSAVLGSGGSASMSGSDTSGTVTISTGNSPAAGCFVRVNFNRPFTSQPRVIISPIGNAAGRTQYYATRDTSGFSICTSAPAPSNQSFGFDYFVAG